MIWTTLRRTIRALPFGTHIRETIADLRTVRGKPGALGAFKDASNPSQDTLPLKSSQKQ